MRVVVVSDEISDDLEEAIQLGRLLGVDAYALRWVRLPGTFRRRRVGDLSDEEAGVLAEVGRQLGVAVSAISPGLFLGPWSSNGQMEGEMARLERSFHLAGILGTGDILMHGFLPPEGRRNGVCPGGVLETLGNAAERAQAAGFRLLLRNTPDSYADTGAHTASIVHAIRSEALSVSWDPCLAVRAGECAICDGYDWVAPFVQDVWVRDQVRHDALGYEYTSLAQGGMDWPAQLQALVRDGFQGTLTLDTQLEPRVLNTVQGLGALRRLLEAVAGES